MMIVCPNCATSYRVEPSSLGAAGRSVRCARCKKTWFAANPEAALAIARSHRDDLAAFTTATSVAADHVESRMPAADATFPVLEAPAPPVAAASVTEAPSPTLPAEEPDRYDSGPEPVAEPIEAVVSEAPPIADHAPAPPAESAPPLAAAAVPEDIESVAARRLRRQPRRKSGIGAGWSTAILGLIAINAGLAIWRADIVRFVPQTASLYAAIGLPVNLRGLVFSEIVTHMETQDGVQLLVVEGIIRSNSPRVTDVPRLRFAVRNVGGQELYSWTALPARNVLPPGATIPFRSRLASPPPEAHSVLVRFFNRRDLVAGIQ
jgi:predicted Zn finger-like uncharacterized protein